MSAVDTATQEEQETGPSWDLGQVNVDSLKQVLSRLADVFPFIDETQSRSFRAQIDRIHEAGDPNEERITPDERDAEIQRLQAQLADLENRSATQVTSPAAPVVAATTPTPETANTEHATPTPAAPVEAQPQVNEPVVSEAVTPAQENATTAPTEGTPPPPGI